MPASVPTGWPKKEDSCGQGRETGHPPESGGWCYKRTAHREDATEGEADDMGAGCMFTQAAPGTAGTSIALLSTPLYLRAVCGPTDSIAELVATLYSVSDNVTV